MRKLIYWLTFGVLCKPRKIDVYFNGIVIGQVDADFCVDDLYIEMPTNIITNLQEFPEFDYCFTSEFVIKGDLFTEDYSELDKTLNILNIPKQSDMEGEAE